MQAKSVGSDIKKAGNQAVSNLSDLSDLNPFKSPGGEADKLPVPTAGDVKNAADKVRQQPARIWPGSAPLQTVAPLCTSNDGAVRCQHGGNALRHRRYQVVFNVFLYNSHSKSAPFPHR